MTRSKSPCYCTCQHSSSWDLAFGSKDQTRWLLCPVRLSNLVHCLFGFEAFQRGLSISRSEAASGSTAAAFSFRLRQPTHAELHHYCYKYPTHSLLVSSTRSESTRAASWHYFFTGNNTPWQQDATRPLQTCTLLCGSLAHSRSTTPSATLGRGAQQYRATFWANTAGT